MNKQALFQAAHATARKIVAAVGDYMVAFKLALKQAWAALKEAAMSITFGIAQNGKHYVEAAPGAFQNGDIVEHKGRFKAVTRKRRGGPAPHPAGDLIRKLKVVGAGGEFNVAPLGDAEPQMRQRFYCELIDEQRIYDAA